jgi:hypothetical protein
MVIKEYIMKRFLCFVSILVLTAVFSFAAGGRDDSSAAGSVTSSTGKNEISNQNLEQRRNSLFMQLTEEERTYLRTIDRVRLSADPASFYNSKEYMWQGKAFDMLIKIQELTGLTFEIVNNNGASYSFVIILVESGEASFFPVLIRTPELENRFIWSESSSEIMFGFNKDEQILCSLFDKTLRFLDIEAIRRQ